MQSQPEHPDSPVLKKRQQISAAFHGFLQCRRRIQPLLHQGVQFGSCQHRRRIDAHLRGRKRRKLLSGAEILFPAAAVQAGHHLQPKRKVVFLHKLRSLQDVLPGVSPPVGFQDVRIHGLRA